MGEREGWVGLGDGFKGGGVVVHVPWVSPLSPASSRKIIMYVCSLLFDRLYLYCENLINTPWGHAEAKLTVCPKSLDTFHR